MKRIALPVFLLLAGAASFAQHDHMAMHQSSTAAIEVKNDAAAQVLTVRLGPVDLPAHADHMDVAQPRDLYFTMPVEGWLLAYHPRLTDAMGNTVPSGLLHHTAFWNTMRSDFVCPNNEEHFFGAGSEMNEWPAVPGMGYRVHRQDRIRVNSMFYNPTDTDRPQTYLEVKIEYQTMDKGSVKSVYPAWFDVQECGQESQYDLKPGLNVTTGALKMAYAGTLLGVGGHMHNYGRQLKFENDTRKENIATLDSKLDAQGKLLEIPIVYFIMQGGYHLSKGDTVRVTATYQNDSGRALPMGAMGMVVGYFIPDNDAAMSQSLVRGQR